MLTGLGFDGQAYDRLQNTWILLHLFIYVKYGPMFGLTLNCIEGNLEKRMGS